MEGHRPPFSLRPHLSMKYPLPAEILDEVLGFLELDHDWKSLSSCSLVCCHNWYPLASRRLFRHLDFHAATAYYPGYTGRRARLASFQDFLTFVKRCERASTYTRSLGLLGWISSGYRGPQSTGPIRTDRLSLDVLINILVSLPKLRRLIIISISMSPPSIFFTPPTKPMFALEGLILDYRAPYQSALYLTPSMSFHLPDVVSLFSSIGEIVVAGVPKLDASAFSIPLASQGGTHVKSIYMSDAGSSETDYFLSALSKALAPGCLSSLDIGWEDAHPPPVRANSDSLEKILEGPGTNIENLHWGVITHPLYGVNQIGTTLATLLMYLRVSDP